MIDSIPIVGTIAGVKAILFSDSPLGKQEQAKAPRIILGTGQPIVGDLRYSVECVGSIDYPGFKYSYFTITLINEANTGILEIVGEIMTGLYGVTFEQVQVTSSPGVGYKVDENFQRGINITVESLNPKEQITIHMLCKYSRNPWVGRNPFKSIVFRAPGITAVQGQKKELKDLITP